MKLAVLVLAAQLAVPLQPTPAPLPSTDLSMILWQVQTCNAQLSVLLQEVRAGRLENQEFYANVKGVWESIGQPIFKYIVPAVVALLAGLKIGHK